MSQTYAIAESGHAEMAALRVQLLNAVKRREFIADGPFMVLATTQSAKRIYHRKLREILARSYVEPNAMGTIAIQCPACKHVSVVMRDVSRFNCECSPAVTRFAHQCRSIDLTAASAAKE